MLTRSDQQQACTQRSLRRFHSQGPRRRALSRLARSKPREAIKNGQQVACQTSRSKSLVDGLLQEERYADSDDLLHNLHSREHQPPLQGLQSYSHGTFHVLHAFTPYSELHSTDLRSGRTVADSSRSFQAPIISQEHSHSRLDPATSCSQDLIRLLRLLGLKLEVFKALCTQYTPERFKSSTNISTESWSIHKDEPHIRRDGRTALQEEADISCEQHFQLPLG